MILHKRWLPFKRKPNQTEVRIKQKYIIGLFIVIIVFAGCSNDNYVNVKNLPKPDCTGQNTVWSTFSKNKAVRLVIPDNPSDSINFNKMSAFKKRAYNDSLIKKESELLDSDYAKALEVYGIIGDFKNWGKLKTPIKQIDKGFEFQDKKYTNKEDGIFYISDNRMVYTGNSLNQIWKQQSTYATYSKYMLFEKGLLSKLCISDTAIIDIKKLRETNYNYTSTKYFNLYIDKTIGMHITDSVVTEICEKLNLKLPNFKINTFIHKDPNATRLFSNFYFVTGCDTLSQDMKINTVQIDGIHVTGTDTEFVKHEFFHYIWNKLVGEHHGNEYFNEGIQEYYQQLLDSSRIKKNVEIYKRHQDYDITNLVVRGNTQDFWGAPTENNWTIAYPISGLFVKFIIDKKGLDIFKQFFIQKDKSKAFVELYGNTDKEMINIFNEWVNEI